jgi:DNA-binding NtrC family response regulator
VPPHPDLAADARPLVFLVDDDDLLCELQGRWLEGDGFAVRRFRDGLGCLRGLTEAQPDAIALDLQMPGLDGLETLVRIKARHPLLPVVIVTSYGSADKAVAAMKAGAYDYLVKPVDQAKLVTEMRNAVERARLGLRVTQLEREVGGAGFPGILGLAPAMRALFRRLDRVASSDITVLIQGESGVGKELVARAIHAQSGRRGGPFVPLNCAAVPETLQESELFGHEKGAFTGAASRHAGAFERADGGTLFLDEISELSTGLQAKLLRALQEHAFFRVGGATEVQSDFRVIAATNRDLEGEVRAGRVREDLYYRIAVMEIGVPPLRERPPDIPLLAEHFLAEEAARARRPAPTLSAGTRDALLRHTWPGNVRELKSAMARALVECDGQVVMTQHLPPRVRSGQPGPGEDRVGDGAEPAAGGAGMTLEALERDAIAAALARHRGNLTSVVSELGIGRTTLYRKLKKYGLR